MNAKEIYFQEPLERVLDKVAFFGDRFILRNKEGEPMAAMVSLEDLQALEAMESLTMQSAMVQIFLAKSDPDNRDYALLKVGKDLYSRKKIYELKNMVSNEIYQQIKAFFVTEKDQAATMRWVLRGLPLDKAIRKVQLDLTNRAMQFTSWITR